jgi:hypothetical protein
LYGLGDRAKNVLDKLAEKIDRKDPDDKEKIKKTANEVHYKQGHKSKRDLFLLSPIGDELSKDDEDGDAAIEEVRFT